MLLVIDWIIMFYGSNTMNDVMSEQSPLMYIFY
jgi:hypothetical protein